MTDLAIIFGLSIKVQIFFFFQEYEVHASKFTQQNSLDMRGSCLVLHIEITIIDQCVMCYLVASNSWSTSFYGLNQRKIYPNNHIHKRN